MTARLIDALLRLSPRERMLLALTAALLPLGVGMALLMPLQDHRSAAQSARAEAEILQSWVMARIDEKQSLTLGIPALSQNPIGTSGIEQALIAARLRPALSALSAEAGGAIDLRFDMVEFVALANWLSDMHPGWGYDITGLRVEAQDGVPGRVAAWVTLRPADG